jgi:hypothetical protein
MQSFGLVQNSRISLLLSGEAIINQLLDFVQARAPMALAIIVFCSIESARSWLKAFAWF